MNALTLFDGICRVDIVLTDVAACTRAGKLTHPYTSGPTLNHLNLTFYYNYTRFTVSTDFSTV